jgi:hypothetical protein
MNEAKTSWQVMIMPHVRNILRGTVFCAGGLCFFAAMLFFGFLAFEYVSGGAGVVFAGFSVTPGGVVFGAIRLLAFAVLRYFAF